MPQVVNGTEYLNATEAAEFLGVSYVTFKAARERFHLQSHELFGKGNARFYKKSDLEQIQRARPETEQ